jgi:hypothetical protein
VQLLLPAAQARLPSQDAYLVFPSVATPSGEITAALPSNLISYAFIEYICPQKPMARKPALIDILPSGAGGQGDWNGRCKGYGAGAAQLGAIQSNFRCLIIASYSGYAGAAQLRATVNSRG